MEKSGTLLFPTFQNFNNNDTPKVYTWEMSDIVEVLQGDRQQHT
jgi:hypothetical protein